MVVVVKGQKALGVKVQRRLGWSDQYGRRRFGCFKYGDDGGYYGIWQSRKKKNGRSQILMPYYWSPKPMKTGNVLQRLKLKQSVLAWQNLTNVQRKAYNLTARKKKRLGYWDFMSQQLKLH